MSAAGTLEQLARELAGVFEPLADRLSAENAADTLATLGLQIPDELAQAPALLTALAQAASAVDALLPAVATLAEAIDGGDDDAMISAGLALIDRIRAVLQQIRALVQTLQSLTPSLSSLTDAQRTELLAFVGELAERLLAELLAEYIEHRYAQLYGAFLAFGVIEVIDVAAGADGSLQTAHQRSLVHFDRALRLLTDPLGLLRDVFQWGQAGFDGVALFGALKLLLDRVFGMQADLLLPAALPATLEAVVFSATVDPSGALPGLLLSWRPAAEVETTQSVPQDDWTLDLHASAKIEADLDFTLRPPFELGLVTPSVAADAALDIGLSRAAAAEPLLLFGQAGGSRLEVGSLSGAVGFTGHWDSGSSAVTLMPALRVAVQRGKLVITGNGGDSLVQQALSGVDLQAPFDLALTWSLAEGLRFSGGAGLVIDLPATVRLGPVELNGLSLGLGVATAGLTVDLAANVGVKLGPLDAQVRRMGLRGLLSFPSAGGNLGPAQLDIAFKPPTGVGLSLATSTVTLAGFLDIDPDAHQYAGAVEIRIVDTFELSAIGIVNTRFPDGSAGFSLMFIIDMVFPTPIALGYNFYLAGVGGMLGLHRTIDIDRLRNGLRAGAVQNILFPTDVVANMSAIVAQLQSIFPPRRDQFIVGPMARITWSSPPLITIELGLVIEFANPVRIAILGLLRAAVPDPDDPIVDIKVAFLGAIDFQLGMLSFDASIYDSYIGRGDFKFSFEGDIAIRLSWGEKKDFLSSVGGFHPAYTAPAYLHVPALRRISISLLKDNPRLRLSSYFAITTNTVQFGAELDFYFKVSGFSVVGDFGFDVLFQFNPFHFIAAVHARLAVRAGGSDLLSLNLAFELQGTTPWKAKGEASFGILFFSVSVHFEKTWGEQQDISFPSIAILPAVLDEFRRDINWKGSLSASATQLVQLFPNAQAAGALLIDAAGVLEIGQTLVPLGAELKRFNNAQPSDISSIDVKELRIAGATVPAATLRDVSEEFAPAAFRELSDEDKLAAASYEPMKGGIAALGSEAFSTDYLIGRPVTYENIVDDGTPGLPPLRSKAPGNVAMFGALVRGGAVGASVLSRRAAIRRQRSTVRDVTTDEERFSVVSTDDLQAVDAQSHGLTRSQAQARLGQLIAAGHGADRIDVIPTYRAA